MINWNNLDTLTSFKELSEVERVNLAEVMSGENGAERVKDYSVPMTEDLTYNYAAKAVDDKVLAALAKLAKEAQLTEKYAALYNGEVINTGEKRLVLHQLTRGQLGDKVEADGVDKREFYVKQQQRIADFANKVHAGEITNAAGEKFTTVVQIGIGGSDLGPRAMYLALENWAKKNGTFKMEAKFISNVDPDDAAAVLNSIDVAHSIFVLVSKSGTTLETLTNESFVKDALKNAGLDASKHMIAVTSETSPLAKSDDYLAAFFMDDYIGGRYSSTSAVGGAVLSLAFGPEVFAQFLAGAAKVDEVSKNEDLLKNPAMLDAMIGVYERNVLGYPATAVLPYSQALSRFPAHLQQLDMESNGKSVNRFGEPVDYPTGPVIFGEPGTNGQHSFYQLLHQGTNIIPLQFIGFKNSQIGIVQGCGPATSLQDTPEYREAVKYCDYFCNFGILDPAIKGYFEPELLEAVKARGIDLSFMKDEDLEIIKNNTVDFLGQNIYSRLIVKPNKSGITAFTVNNAGNNDGTGKTARETRAIAGWFESDRDTDTRLNKWGREIYPKCAYNTLMLRKERYGNIPIYVTENGHGCYDVPDENGYVEDDDRIAFLNDYIGWILKAKEDGVNVKGYYCWSTMDLYSWINGYKKRYGLVRVDYEDGLLRRIPKKSYYWYRDFIAEHKDV